MATPIEEARSRCGSRVEFSATTAKTTSPGCRYFTPSFRASSLQLGGKIEETRTRFWAAIPASRNANSNEVNRSRCFPTPLVKKIRFGTMSLPNSYILRKISLGNAQSNTMLCKEKMNCRAKYRNTQNWDLSLRPDQCWNLHSRALESEARAYCAALTEVTEIVLSFSLPVTVAFAPACLSRVARAALSLVSSV